MMLIAAILIVGLAVLFLIGFGLQGTASKPSVELGSQTTLTQRPNDHPGGTELRRRGVGSPLRDRGSWQSGGIDPEDRRLGEPELERIRSAALAIAGPGTVTEVDRSDDLGEAYEVEIVTERGEVDVALDRNFERVPNLRYDD
jgi:hypothetical protein